MSLCKRIIARLDIKGSKLIKGIRFEGLRVVGDPWEASLLYSDQGVDELLYIDAVASLYGRNSLSHLLERTCRNVFIPITAGGGIRSVSDAGDLLRSGADKVAINTAALKSPSIITDIATKFGSQSIVASIQARRVGYRSYEAMSESGRERSGLDVVQWISKVEGLGAGEILLTSVDKDGTLKGPDLELLSLVSSITKLPLIFGGGISSISDVSSVLSSPGLAAVSIGAALHNRSFITNKAKNILNLEDSVSVRISRSGSNDSLVSTKKEVRVGIINYGLGNQKSLFNALEHAGAQVILSSDFNELNDCNILALPGVGAFPEGMKQLKQRGLDEFIRDWANSNKPLIGICLGMQMLFQSSEEFVKTEGLGLLEGRVVKLNECDNKDDLLTLPNIGWSMLSSNVEDWDSIDGEYQYFVHSYAALESDSSCKLAYAYHGDQRFIAAVKKENLYGFQFHPERSGSVGLGILKEILGSFES